MYTIDKEKAKKILVTELGYPPGTADVFLRDFPPLHDELAEPVNRWLEDRTVQDVSVCGLSMSEVMRTQRYNVLLAAKYMNRLLDPALPPERREKLVASLRKPAVRW